MYILQPRDPDFHLRNELIHTYEEAVRMEGTVAIVHTDSARRHLILKLGFVDITDQTLDRKSAAKELKATIPNVDAWVRNGTLQAYGSGKDAVFLSSDVEKLRQNRGAST